MPNSNLLQLNLINIIITRLIKYMVAIVGNMAKGIINDYKVKVEVLMEVYSKVIARRSITFIRSQIASQLGTPLMSKRGHITSFARAHKTSETKRSLRPTSKASWFNMKAKKISRVRLMRLNSSLWI